MSGPRIELRSRRILRDGVPVLVLAGELHYFRVPRAEWGQRLDLLREVGCDCVASYIPWLFHELPDGSIDVTGRTRPERDVDAFIALCAERGLSFLARPGPFVMAELKNEGLPYRLYTEHPEIVPVGWDAAANPNRSVDYLAPAFLTETERWYDAVLPLLAARQPSRGGPLMGVQLDNEIGMLAWIGNAPDLSDGVLADFRRWCEQRHGPELAARYPLDPPDWTTAIRSPQESWAAALRVDLGRFFRDRFARYVAVLAGSVRRHGLTEVPLFVNVHGTTDGDGVPFAIGLSQLYPSYRGHPGLAAGSDHYLGELTPTATSDLHFVNAAMIALNGEDQPATSLEFEAGTGDYGGAAERLDDPSTAPLKTRLFLAQGNRLINYYLLAGGINPPLDTPTGDGNDRISFTGERHGTAAPIGPEGQRGLAFGALAETLPTLRTHARWLADADEEHDDLAVGFWPDAFMTEYRHLGSTVMTTMIDDLTRYRGVGAGRNLWLPLLQSGFRFGAADLQSATTLPRVIAIATGRVLDAEVQRRLVAHLQGDGALLLLGRLPDRDTEGRPCRLLADELQLRAGIGDESTADRFCSVVGSGLLESLPELRVARPDELLTATAHRPLLHDLDGRLCGLRTDVAGGPAVVITAAVPPHSRLLELALEGLGCRPGLAMRSTVPGVLVLTGRTPRGERLLHLINPTGYSAQVRLEVGDPTGVLDRPLDLPARSGFILGIGLRLPGGGRLLSANAELQEVTSSGLRFGPTVQDHTEVWLETPDQRRRRVTGTGPQLVVDL